MGGSGRSVWRLGALVGAVPVALLVAAGPALAPHEAQLQATPTSVNPGEEITVFGPAGYGATNPVEIRLDSETGPVLGSFKPNPGRFAQWGPGTIVIPADTRPGPHVLWATQDLPDSDSHIRGIPARALIEVLGPASQPLVGAVTAADSAGPARPETLVTTEDTAGWGAVLLVGLGAAGLAMLAAGAVAVTVSRRSAGAPGAPASPVAAPAAAPKGER